MRNRKSMLCVVAVVIMGAMLFTACSAKRPSWYLNPPESDEIIYGTGASEKTASQ